MRNFPRPSPGDQVAVKWQRRPAAGMRFRIHRHGGRGMELQSAAPRIPQSISRLAGAQSCLRPGAIAADHSDPADCAAGTSYVVISS